MKKIIFILALTISSCSLSAKDIPGYYINKEDEKIAVVFKIPIKSLSDTIHYQLMQFDIKYIDPDNKTIIKLKPSDAKEFGFSYLDQDIRFISVENTLRLNKAQGLISLYPTEERIFLKLIIEGKANLYRYYQTTGTPISSYQAPHMSPHGISPTSVISIPKNDYLIQKNDEPVFKASKKKLAEHFKDCPDLIKKLGSEKFKKKQTISIVLEYNNCL